MAKLSKDNRLLLQQWLGLSDQERFNKDLPTTRTGMASRLGITFPTFKRLADGIEREQGVGEVADEAYDSMEYLKSRTPETDRALIQSCIKGNAGSQRTLYQLLGRLVEKTEAKVEFGLSAEELARQYRENQRWLREHDFVATEGVGQVQPEQPLLSENIREDTG